LPSTSALCTYFTQQVIVDRSTEAVSLALGMLEAELEQFMKSHTIPTHYADLGRPGPPLGCVICCAKDKATICNPTPWGHRNG
jgi:hypothetical protein